MILEICIIFFSNYHQMIDFRETFDLRDNLMPVRNQGKQGAFAEHATKCRRRGS